MKHFFRKHFPEQRLLASKGGYIPFEAVGVQPNAIGIIALDSENPNDVSIIEDLVKRDKEGHRGSVVEIAEPEYDELKKKYASLPSPLSTHITPQDGRLRLSPGPNQRKIGRQEAAAPAVAVAPEPAPVAAPLPIRKPRLARPRQTAETTA